MGAIDSATTVYEAILARPGRDPEIEAMAHYNLGDVNLRSGSVEPAIEHFRASLALDSSGARSYNNYALALIQGHRAPEALALLGRGLARFPSAEPLLKNAALASLELQDTTAARRYLDQAIAANPRYAAALGLRARVRAHGGDRAGALADWHAFANSEPPPLQSEYDDVLRDLVDHGVTAEEHAHPIGMPTPPAPPPSPKGPGTR
jgi:tetratricopeptide (TPR) repeat protein